MCIAARSRVNSERKVRELASDLSPLFARDLWNAPPHVFAQRASCSCCLRALLCLPTHPPYHPIQTMLRLCSPLRACAHDVHWLVWLVQTLSVLTLSLRSRRGTRPHRVAQWVALRFGALLPSGPFGCPLPVGALGVASSPIRWRVHRWGALGHESRVRVQQGGQTRGRGAASYPARFGCAGPCRPALSHSACSCLPQQLARHSFERFAIADSL